jgi:hypothetical protein
MQALLNSTSEAANSDTAYQTAASATVINSSAAHLEQLHREPKLLFPQFVSAISRLSNVQLSSRSLLDPELRLFQSADLEAWYTPFEYINADAKLVVVGITPGETQLLNALREARTQLRAGAGMEDTLKAAKYMGAFSGPLRQHLVALLDHVGFHNWLGISSTQDLFGVSRHLLHTTSILRHAVFYKGKNYNGTPDMLRHSRLCQSILDHFAIEAASLRHAVFVPLGDKVAKALDFVVSEGVLSQAQILDGLPHPSPANIERIHFFTGQKCRSALSAKTNAERIASAREKLFVRVGQLAKTS